MTSSAGPESSTPPRRGAPAPLVVAASLVAVEGLLLVVYGVAELFALSGDRVSMGLTTAVFFLLYGVGLVWCARALARLRSWARAPVVLAQLIQVLVGWGFRGAGTTAVAVAMMAVGVIVLVGVFHPASLTALARED